jgi:hypothetical protein
VRRASGDLLVINEETHEETHSGTLWASMVLIGTTSSRSHSGQSNAMSCTGLTIPHSAHLQEIAPRE